VVKREGQNLLLSSQSFARVKARRFFVPVIANVNVFLSKLGIEKKFVAFMFLE